MRRAVALAAAALAIGVAACNGRDVVVPTSSLSPTPTRTTATPSPTTSPPSEPPPPSPSPRPIPPAWAAPIEEDLAPEELDDAALVPPGAQLLDRITLEAAGDVPDQVAVTYVIGEDPFAAEHGVAVWQRFDEPPAWSVVLAFVDPPARGVLGIRMQAGDLTGDGHDEVLTFEETGGSGACGRWRVLAATGVNTEQVFARQTCDTEILLVGGALEVREAVYEPDDPHCCPSAFRTTTLEWDGEAFEETDVRVEPVG